MILRLSIRTSASGDAVFPVLWEGDRLRLGANDRCDVSLPPALAGTAEVELRRASGATQRWEALALDGTDRALLDGEPLLLDSATPVRSGARLNVGECEIIVRTLEGRSREGSSPGLGRDELTAAIGAASDERSRSVDARPGVRDVSGPAADVLVVINGPQRGRATPPLRSGEGLAIGRSRACDVTLPDPRVSRHHARLGMGSQGLRIRPTGGVGGVRVNGRRVLGSKRLVRGDLVDIGGTRLEVRAARPGAYERIARPAGTATVSWGPGRRALNRLGWGPALAELDRWHVVDPVGFALGIAGMAAGVAGLVVG